MKPRIALLVDGLLLLVNCAASRYLVVTVNNTQLQGVFVDIVTNAPSNPITTLNCP